MKQLSERELKIKYKHFKDPGIGGIITQCHVISPETNESGFGISIRSIKESWSKKEGRNRSLGRALKALIKKEDSDIIKYPTLKDEYHIRKIKDINPNKKIIVNLTEKFAYKNNNKYYYFKIPIEYTKRLAINMGYTHKSFYMVGTKGM